MMLTHVQQLIQSRDLLLSWVVRTIRGRYQQSALGWLWAIIQPAAIVVVFTVIFTYFVPIDTGDIPYPVFSYVAVIPWAFLAASLGDMTISVVANMNLVTKIYFTREVLPIAAMLARLMDMGISAALLIVLILVYQLPTFPMGWLFLPLILLIQIALVLGCGLFASALNVFYRDVGSILPLGIQLWFYASPIIYPVSMVPEQLQPYYFLNPMAGILESYRAVLLYQSLPGNYLIYSGVVSIVVFILGYWFFKRVEYLFADII